MSLQVTDYAALIRMIACVLVSKPDAVLVTMARLEDTLTIRLSVDPADAGNVVGSGGRTLKAIRVIVEAAAKKDNLRVRLDAIA